MRNNKRRDVVLGIHFINRSNMTNKTTTNYLLNHIHTGEREREKLKDNISGSLKWELKTHQSYYPEIQDQ